MISIPYIYTVDFDRNFVNNEDLCYYINSKINEMRNVELANGTVNGETQEIETLQVPVVPFVRPNRYGFVQIWSPVYYRLMECTALSILGFDSCADSEEVETAQEAWSSLSFDERAATYAQRTVDAGMFVAPRPMFCQNDKPTDLYIIKDEGLFQKGRKYALFVVSDFFRSQNARWWANELNILPKLRENFVRYASTTAFECQYWQ